MRLKVKLCDTVAMKNLVLAAEHLPCDVDLQSGSFVVDAKSILGVLGLPKKDTGILCRYTPMTRKSALRF